MKALIVDDDLALADIVSFTLRRAGYEVTVAHDGLTALETWSSGAPDLIILDLNLPKLDGLAVCQQIRSQSETPIIILSVRAEEDDVVRGLKLGADDYIIKPFSPRQLIARIEAVLRRSGTNSTFHNPLEVGNLSLDPSRRKVSLCGQFIAQLTPLESRLFEVLMRNSGQVLTTDFLIDHTWGPEGGDRGMLKQLIYRLRMKIETDTSGPQFIETVPGIGYSLVHQTIEHEEDHAS
ncbi:MAG: response regulator transcription factor [Anaerolineaceae bacterium]|nr:MAG: response regulator transcription factor [Anaerolineaceae bacterium]